MRVEGRGPESAGSQYGLGCPPEVALDRLASGLIPHPGRVNRLAAKLQGRFASLVHLRR